MGAPSTPLVAGVHAVVVAAAFLLFGYALARPLARRVGLDPVVTSALAVPALAAFAVVLMLGHIATGGALLRSAAATRIVVAGAALGAVAAEVVTRRGGRRGSGSVGDGEGPRSGNKSAGNEDAGRLAGGSAEWEDDRRGRERGDLLAAGGALVLALAVWGTPVFRLLPLDPMPGDTPLHMGFAAQLLNGETTPSGSITGEIPNFYPWLFHAITALVATFTPGGRPFHALGPVHLLQAVGAVLALFALGRQLTSTRVGGLGAALLGGLAGGVGFVWLRGLDVVVYPRSGEALRYAGDLLYKRSYNVAFANLAPPFPRDLALTLFLAFLVLLAIGLARGRLAPLVLAGICLGAAGLTGGEAFIVGVAMTPVAVLWGGSGPALRRLSVAAAVLVPSLATWAIWAAPLAASYLRLGGFVNLTRVTPIDLSPAEILVAWGVGTPVAVYALARPLRELAGRRDVRVVLSLLLVAGAVLAASVLLPAWLGEGFLSLGRRHRYWPFVHLAVTLLAAVGVADLARRLTRQRVVALAAAVVLAAVALPSAAVASLAQPEVLRRAPLVEASLRGWPTLLTLVARAGRARCTVAAPLGLDRTIFSYTGYRLVLYKWRYYERNMARIRWRDIYERIPGDTERLRANEALTEGSVSRATWGGVARRFGVDIVVVPHAAAQREAFRGREARVGRRSGERYHVIFLTGCGRP